MGFFQRIQNWFKRRSAHFPLTPNAVAASSSFLHLPKRPDDEVGVLVWEHEQLDYERSTLKSEMTQVDSRYAGGEIAAGDRDRAYRLCLARAGRITLRQMEIRRQLVQLGYEVPSEWGVIR